MTRYDNDDYNVIRCEQFAHRNVHIVVLESQGSMTLNYTKRPINRPIEDNEKYT